MADILQRTLKPAVLATLLTSMSLVGHAATKGPDSGGYTATDATVYSFVDVSASGASVLSGTDDGTAVLTLPFTFQFYGHSYTMVCASTNGALYFIQDPATCSGFNDFANTDMTVAAPPGDLPAVLPFWSDLTFQVPGAGSIFYATVGPSGHRRFVVQWNNAYPQGSQNPVTFQVVLSETLNTVLFQYNTVNLGAGNPASNGGLATIGIRNSGGIASGQQIEWSYNAPVVSDGAPLVFSAALAGGTPNVSGVVSSKSSSGTTRTLVLQFANNGAGNGQNVQINQLTLRTLSGSGTVSVISPTLPATLGNLAVGSFTTLTVTLNVPSTVTRFSITEGGSVQDLLGNPYNFSIAQSVIP